MSSSQIDTVQGSRDAAPVESDVRTGENPQWSNKIRLVTATSLFDGHDASINIMRRIAQSCGAEVIHLGHNRSAEDIVQAAIDEDVQGIAISSYQGGHTEFFRYTHDLLAKAGCSHIKVFGGGGGVILLDEIEELHRYGIERIYSPDDGRKLGLEGMIRDMLRRCDFATPQQIERSLEPAHKRELARAVTLAELAPGSLEGLLAKQTQPVGHAPVLGITGTGGAGKSSLIDELVLRFLRTMPEDKTIAVLSVDPTRRKTGGALLGDRIRMNAVRGSRVFMRSMATRRANVALSEAVGRALRVLRAAGFDLIILESSGIGQSDTEITEHADTCLYVMTPEFGAASQLEKIDMLDFADIVAINKFDRRGALDALRDVRKQVQRNRNAWDTPPEQMPVFGTMASNFNDEGMNALFRAIIEKVAEIQQSRITGADELPAGHPEPHRRSVIPAERGRYLAEIAESARQHEQWIETQATAAEHAWQLAGAAKLLTGDAQQAARQAADRIRAELDPTCRDSVDGWDDFVESFRSPKHSFKVREKTIEIEQQTTSLSGLQVPKVALPRYRNDGDRLRWILRENVPGRFPFTAGVFPFKRKGEDPTRMFAGEGGPERTNARFHYVSEGQPAKRLSTAFDSVTLYGENPALRPDIYGKVGNSGVSICTLDDAKRLYSGFDLCDPMTSVSMTINGPAPMLLAFFMNAAIDQQCERWLQEHGKLAAAQESVRGKWREHDAESPTYRGQLPQSNDGNGTALLGASGDEVVPPDVYSEIKARTLSMVRGTVQADILKEDQAQNTCIFSTEFALRLMGDVQQFFTENDVRNFYSVSISGYHIAEAGANPITQLAFTLSNGFTYVEYYLSRGLQIDDFAPNLSFFFSNGTDPEYSVIGRVARRIWARAIKHRYGGNERSQKLKYHIQTSGRSLHAQEIAFNDIRTTLQALYAIYDNCNSLHTNAYDEAITTPTEESVRRAMAIQLIINRELGLAKNENPNQGSFIVEELTDLVEEAVYAEFERLTERGGVLGAMETMYQRGKIQEESIHYETLKSTGELPIVGVNTFLGPDGSPIQEAKEVMRSSDDEKKEQIAGLDAFHKRYADQAPGALAQLRQAALDGRNMFAELLEAAKVCSLGQLSAALYDVGGQYRRNM